MKFAALPFFLLATIAGAQTPSFEVASIRPSTTSRVNDVHYDTTPNSLTVRGAALRALIQWAWDVPPFQVEGPGWIDSAGFDVTAKSGTNVTEDQLRLMLRTALASRLGVAVHNDPREMQTYSLTVAKGGPKFKESTSEGPPEFTNAGKGMLVANRVTMAELASKISEPLQKPVIDATGLKGRYDIRIDVTAYMTEAAQGGGSMDVMSILFNALQAQLGVKLDSRKQNVNMLVVDKAEKTPTDN